MNIVVLDDERTIHKTPESGNLFDVMVPVHFKDCLTAMQFFELRVNEPFVLFLDHDLGYYKVNEAVHEHDAKPFARFLMEEQFTEEVYKESVIYVHSMNPVGAEWLVKELKPKWDVRRIPLPKYLYVDEDQYEGLQIID